MLKSKSNVRFLVTQELLGIVKENQRRGIPQAFYLKSFLWISNLLDITVIAAQGLLPRSTLYNCSVTGLICAQRPKPAFLAPHLRTVDVPADTIQQGRRHEFSTGGTDPDWGGRIQVSQNHLPPNSHFSSDFAHPILGILENPKALAKKSKILFKNRDFWGAHPPEFRNVPRIPPPPPVAPPTLFKVWKRVKNTWSRVWTVYGGKGSGWLPRIGFPILQKAGFPEAGFPILSWGRMLGQTLCCWISG